GHAIEKRLFLPYRRNTVHVLYRLLDGPGPVRLKLRPSVHFRGHDGPVNPPSSERYVLTAIDQRYELSLVDPSRATVEFGSRLALPLEGERAALTLDAQRTPEVRYRIEEGLGYDGVGTLWSPGQFRVTLTKDRDVVLTASTEPWDVALALPARPALEAEL